jgi:hypothetical protein
MMVAFGVVRVTHSVCLIPNLSAHQDHGADTFQCWIFWPWGNRLLVSLYMNVLESAYT